MSKSSPARKQRRKARKIVRQIEARMMVRAERDIRAAIAEQMKQVQANG